MVQANMIFVFGSNLAGRHGKGAALHAALHYGAERGVGEGRTGNSYAIPTKDARMRVRTWEEVCTSVVQFLHHAVTEGAQETFLLTPIGCGLAGYRAADMWEFLQTERVPDNVVLSAHWVNDHDIQGA